MSNQLYNQNSRRKIYIVRHIITVRFPFTYHLSRSDFLWPCKILLFINIYSSALWH